MEDIVIPENYDYVGVFLTDRCHLSCEYCITRHHGSPFGKSRATLLTPGEWIEGLNRFVLPEGVPVTLQGGEPFLYKGIWEILGQVTHKMDILTALPSFVKRETFERLKTLDWNKREAPYPTIRVSYHKGQNDFQKLIEMIGELQEVLSIGLFYLETPLSSDEEMGRLRETARRHSVELRSKEFLGEHEGERYGTYLYEEGCSGKRAGMDVLCRNTVAPVGTDGTVYRCHSDLYFRRDDLALGNILDEVFSFPREHLPCSNYGLCSECDIKVKTNHHQVYGYTSVDIKFL